MRFPCHGTINILSSNHLQWMLPMSDVLCFYWEGYLWICVPAKSTIGYICCQLCTFDRFNSKIVSSLWGWFAALFMFSYACQRFILAPSLEADVRGALLLAAAGSFGLPSSASSGGGRRRSVVSLPCPFFLDSMKYGLSLLFFWSSLYSFLGEFWVLI